MESTDVIRVPFVTPLKLIMSLIYPRACTYLASILAELVVSGPERD
jgi:hypothetical protein